jgi:hypothetical protein
MTEHSKGQPPQPTRSLKQFEVLLGEWHMDGTHPLLPVALHGHSTFEWLRKDALLIWRFEWEPGSQIPNAFSVIGHDDEGGPYSMLYTDVRGVSRIYQMSLDGGIWKQWRDSPDFSQRMTGTFNPDGSIIRTQGELLRDNANWEPDLSVSFTRKA